MVWGQTLLRSGGAAVLLHHIPALLLVDHVLPLHGGVGGQACRLTALILPIFCKLWQILSLSISSLLISLRINVIEHCVLWACSYSSIKLNWDNMYYIKINKKNESLNKWKSFSTLLRKLSATKLLYSHNICIYPIFLQLQKDTENCRMGQKDTEED